MQTTRTQTMYALRRDNILPTNNPMTVDYGVFIISDDSRGNFHLLSPIEVTLLVGNGMGKHYETPEEAARAFVANMGPILEHMGHLCISLDKPAAFPEIDLAWGKLMRYHAMEPEEKERFVNAACKALSGQ